MNNSYVRLNAEEYAARKNENKELQNIRKKELFAKQILYDLINNTIEKTIIEKREQQNNKEKTANYIRPKMRFNNGTHLRKSIY